METDVTGNGRTDDHRSLERDIILDILLGVDAGSKCSSLLDGALDKYRYLPKQERAFITRCTEGTLEYRIAIDSILDRFSKVKVPDMKPVIRNILRMSVYQLLYMDRIADASVVNLAVSQTAAKGFKGLTGFVNGVLRSISRARDDIIYASPELAYSIPAWVFSMWEEDYGRDTAEEICTSFLSERPLTVRYNLSLASEDEITDGLRAQGIAVGDTPFGSAIHTVSGYDTPDSIDEFKNGHIVFQDPSSAMAALCAAPKKGDLVLDVCAAPGGKSLHAADILAGSGMVEARDLTEYKVGLIEENRARCGFSNIRTKVWDALVADGESLGKADIVLADLPCSGLGVIGRKPDIKARIKKEDIDDLAGLQRKMLSVVSDYVKPGGTLVYSTCTIDRAENEDNAEWIIEELPFEKIDIADRLPECLRGICRCNMIQILPGPGFICDGFFIAAFRRKEI